MKIPSKLKSGTLKSRTLRAGLLGALGALSVSAGVYAADAHVDAARVSALLKARLPKTEVGTMDCDKVAGLCEVVAGKSLFYVDHGARYLFIGRVYDMQTRQDLTAAKLLEINPGLLLGGAANAGAREEEGAESPAAALAAHGGAPAGPVAGAAQPAAARRVDLSKLGPAGAVVWGKADGTPVTIFTDFHCGYCRALVSQLETMNVRVIERPISTLGSRDIANRVLCARDKGRAVRAAYAGEALPAATCDTSGLDANERFARVNAFSGTPVIVRSDGEMLEGYRSRDILEPWLKAARR